MLYYFCRICDTYMTVVLRNVLLFLALCITRTYIVHAATPQVYQAEACASMSADVRHRFRT